ncbi:S1C family serine protease [Actinoplanes friuliensis]|jgi:putative serine protease PepD|uniref:Putative serine protease n=1 Tax=Actinoplanes friuliensis DSM 7358 TaxID=1246995 RepID=U5W7V5_9ACTN|nr:S1C family serine protease [Actinoplanes friuliensis]AGZ45293.1 putative serine protease [Actinoplanes friuliensis DSM 7358]
MTTAYDPFGVPGPRRAPQDPLLSLPDHPSGEWATAPRAVPRIGHPRPARRAPGPYLPSPTGAAPYPVVAEPSSEPAVLNGRGRSRLMTILLVIVLLLVAGWQAWRLDRVDHRLVTSTEQLTAAIGRQDQLADRADRLEKQLAAVFDPEAISQTVLPSVFRVRAGNFTGTAFSVGDKAADGQANLLTNYHVVESVWESGNRKVFLERGKDELSATIVKVSKNKDLALLRANRKIAGLDTAPATVKPGQQVVVVGAPLGLEDTVTTGVVSAYRPDDAEGPSIQFDAPINPGNSGGPVVNSEDEVIGLATAKARDAEGIGIAVPIKTACDAFKVC